MLRQRRASAERPGIEGTAKVLTFNEVGEGNSLDAITETMEHASSSDSEGAHIVQGSEDINESEEDTLIEVSALYLMLINVFKMTFSHRIEYGSGSEE